ncbi:RagB/SusD family nutrient uptake outer membrane protein [Chitinophaga sp. GCM10012297]|uniref:RagB/SusD family nutrient uptake outer membrane protein n=1 Tax=Chitinophaga chungangae TaxID=2821488 RepID=A0ABS3YIY0_9BACT|nr:RagB/SusD family nutrient uptake outer membrane protein [Chitinophaga chungangae]MBO9154390.1 RagB/SusD family nutrient uptake outer membrane protein [Chitinophaga chungangae]
MTNKQHNTKRYIQQSILALAIAGSAGFMSGCKSDLLDTVPPGNIASSTMWTTDNLTDLGVAGVYNALRLGIATGGASGRELYMYDRFVTSIGRDGDALLQGTATTGNGMFTNVWKELYEGVHRANDAITSIPAKSPSPAEKKARYVAEMKFMRAYFYMRLNQLWKGVPVYLEPVPVDQMNRGRETEQAVWDVVVQDLTDAINEPELPMKYAKGNAAFGHATKGAAYALRGKAYMYLEQWALAAADFQKVREAGYSLFGNYYELFRPANEQSDEMIFSIQYNNVPGFGSTTQFYTGTRSSFGSCWNSYMVHPDLVDRYENADGSPFDWDAVIPGYNAMPAKQREVYFFRNNLTAAEITAAKNRGVNMDAYLPDGNEQRIAQAYAGRDPRLTANVITPYSTYLGRQIEGADRVFTYRWPHRNENLPTLDLTTDTRTFFYYLHRKFVYLGSTELPDRTTGPTDFPLIRFADVLLMWAEALNEQGKTDEAVPLVNEVRQRAGVGLLNSSPATTVTGQDDMRQRIRHERRAEFPNEGISFFDEMRWKTWKETVFYTGNGVKEIWGNVNIPYLWSGDYLYNWAIPEQEVQMNGNLRQNPDWIN